MNPTHLLQREARRPQLPRLPLTHRCCSWLCWTWTRSCPFRYSSETLRVTATRSSQGTYTRLGFCSKLSASRDWLPSSASARHPGDNPFFHTPTTSCTPPYVLTGGLSNLFWKLRHAPISVLAFYASSQKNSQTSAIQAPENKGLHLDAWMQATGAIRDALRHPRYTWGWQISHRTYGSSSWRRGDHAGYPRVSQMVLDAKAQATESSSKNLVCTEGRCTSPVSNKHVSCRAAKQQKSYKRIAPLFRVCWNLAELTGCVSLFCYEHIMLTEPDELLR